MKTKGDGDIEMDIEDTNDDLIAEVARLQAELDHYKDALSEQIYQTLCAADDVRQLKAEVDRLRAELEAREKHIKKLKNRKLLCYCVRCGGRWREAGEILKMQPNYEQIEEAMCRECSKEVYDKRKGGE